MTQLKGVYIGAGYFSQFHYDGWQRIPEVQLIALCDTDPDKAEAIAHKFNIAKVYTDYEKMLDQEQPDFVDVITPPVTHQEICQSAFDRKINVICQKPLAPTYAEAEAIVQAAQQANVRFMVHENFRFQPWHREIKKLLEQRVIGDRLHMLNLRCRMGDGWGEDAYLDRQPYFREMPKLFVYETGVHFIDVFRYLVGEIDSVYAQLKTLNPVIKGEDSALMVFQFANGSTGIADANRYNESNQPNPRYTFGEMLIEGRQGSIRLYADGKLTIQLLGKPEREHQYHHEDRGFAGDCCYTTQQHFVDCLLNNQPFETNGSDYLKTLRVQEAVYESAKRSVPVQT
ncbi:MAG: Gfo/Idh/MocA family oxidoreductase [Bacteroidota bacterium]